MPEQKPHPQQGQPGHQGRPPQPGKEQRQDQRQEQRKEERQEARRDERREDRRDDRPNKPGQPPR